MFYLGRIHGLVGRPARELPTRIVLGVAVLVNGTAAPDGAPVAPPPRLGLALGNARHGVVLQSRLGDGARRQGRQGRQRLVHVLHTSHGGVGQAAFRAPVVALRGGAAAVLGRGVARGLRRVPGLLFGSREAHNWLPKPARPTTFLILVGARRRVAGVSRSRPDGLSPHGTRRDGCWCLLVPYMPLARRRLV